MEMAQGPKGKPSESKNAQVRFGAWNSTANHAGKTIGQVRQELGKVWGIPDNTNARIGKNQVDEDYVIQPNDKVEFHRRGGEKGS